MLKRTHSYSVILAIAAAGAVWTTPTLLADQGADTSNNRGQQDIQQGQNSTNTLQNDNKANVNRAPASNETVDAVTAMQIRSRLGNTINDAVSRNGFNDLVNDLDKPARDRIGQENNKDLDKLNASVDQFRKDFHDRYNTDFDFKSALLNNVQIYRGADKDSARISLIASQGWYSDGSLKTDARIDTLNNNAKQNADHLSNGGNQDHLVPQTINHETGQANTSGNVPPQNIPGTPNPADRPNVETSRIDTYNNAGNVANGTDAMPSDVTFVRDGLDWRLQAPSTLTGNQLAQALSTRLNSLCSNKDKWPSDINQAYLKIGRHVLRTIENPQPDNITVENR